MSALTSQNLELALENLIDGEPVEMEVAVKLGMDREILRRAVKITKPHLNFLRGYFALDALYAKADYGGASLDENEFWSFLERHEARNKYTKIVYVEQLRDSWSNMISIYLTRNGEWLVVKKPWRNAPEDIEEYFEVFTSTDEMLNFLAKKVFKTVYHSLELNRTSSNRRKFDGNSALMIAESLLGLIDKTQAAIIENAESVGLSGTKMRKLLGRVSDNWKEHVSRVGRR